MEVKIGVQHAPRELVVETDASPEDIEAQLTEAVTSSSLFRFTDTRGKVGYIDRKGTVEGAVKHRGRSAPQDAVRRGVFRPVIRNASAHRILRCVTWVMEQPACQPVSSCRPSAA